MKNKKALAIALSAGLVLGGAFALDSDNLAYAADGEETTAEQPDPNTEETDNTAGGSDEDKPAEDDKEEDKPAEDDKEEDKPAGDDKEEDKPAGDDKEEDNKESTDWAIIEDIAEPIYPLPSIDIDIDKEKEEDKEDSETVLITSEEVDDLIKDIDNRDQEIREELKRIDSNVVVDDDKKPADDDKKPVEDDKDEKEDDSEAKPSKDKKEKVVVKEIIKDAKAKEAVRVPAVSHNNPKTGVAGLSAVAGTLAVSMAGIVATKKKND